MQSSNLLYNQALELFPYTPQSGQDALLRELCHFAYERPERGVFLVRGYAGTGKTSVIAALTQALAHTRIKTVLLAPTGRAAKVLAQYAGYPANTIHKRLYRGDSLSPGKSDFFLAPNKDRDTLFIVDEASMIGVRASRLLEHLCAHIYSSPGCAMIMVGDTAQLPPVGESRSEAMQPATLEFFGLRVREFDLTHPLRQAHRSGILYNATRLRRNMTQNPLPQVRLWPARFADVSVCSNEFLAEQIADSYSEVGQDSTLIITRANWRASAFNRAIRGTVLYAESILQKGERLVVAKNNYFWSSQVKGLSFIANGEAAVVERIYGEETRYGHNWADVELRLLDSGAELPCKLLLTCLDNDAPALEQDRYTLLYQAVQAHYLKTGLDSAVLLKAIRTDPYLNAIQAKYGYCLTCHKAQGGQWKHVYIDLSGIGAEFLREPEIHRWLYTAVTRAITRLWLINPSIPMNDEPDFETALSDDTV